MLKKKMLMMFINIKAEIYFTNTLLNIISPDNLEELTNN